MAIVERPEPAKRESAERPIRIFLNEVPVAVSHGKPLRAVRAGGGLPVVRGPHRRSRQPCGGGRGARGGCGVRGQRRAGGGRLRAPAPRHVGRVRPVGASARRAARGRAPRVGDGGALRRRRLAGVHGGAVRAQPAPQHRRVRARLRAGCGGFGRAAAGARGHRAAQRHGQAGGAGVARPCGRARQGAVHHGAHQLRDGPQGLSRRVARCWSAASRLPTRPCAAPRSWASPSRRTAATAVSASCRVPSA